MRKTAKGFTLVELLVVISVIAMLLAILIPSLNKARQIVCSMVCRSHMRQYGMAMSTYTTEWNNFFAGPNTSGVKLNSNPPLPPESSQTSPVQNMDWISPTLGRQLGLPRYTRERMARILNTDLRCPANNEKYDYVYTPASVSVHDWAKSNNVGADILRYSSFSAILGFHVYNSKVTMGTTKIITAADVDSKVEIPFNYRPKMQMIGKPAEKIYAIDGARYISVTAGSSFNDFAKQIAGGNFMLYGPALPLSGDPFAEALKGIGANRHVEPSKINFQYGWRHNKGLNAVFFDGHCRTLSVKDSLNISYYFPKGTKVINAALTQDLHAVTGMIID